VLWVSWHTFRRTHATLLQLAGGTAKDPQAQPGHSQITTTLGIYTIPAPAHQREAAQMVTDGTSLDWLENPESVNTRYCSELDGGRYRIRTCDFHRVNLSLFVFTTTYKCVEVAKTHAGRTRHRSLWIGLWIGNLQRDIPRRPVPVGRKLWYTLSTYRE
jgi:hypothetical protein